MLLPSILRFLTSIRTSFMFFTIVSTSSVRTSGPQSSVPRSPCTSPLCTWAFTSTVWRSMLPYRYKPVCMSPVTVLTFTIVVVIVMAYINIIKTSSLWTIPLLLRQFDSRIPFLSVFSSAYCVYPRMKSIVTTTLHFDTPLVNFVPLPCMALRKLRIEHIQAT